MKKMLFMCSLLLVFGACQKEDPISTNTNKTINKITIEKNSIQVNDYPTTNNGLAWDEGLNPSEADIYVVLTNMSNNTEIMNTRKAFKTDCDGGSVAIDNSNLEFTAQESLETLAEVVLELRIIDRDDLISSDDEMAKGSFRFNTESTHQKLEFPDFTIEFDVEFDYE